MRVYLAGLEASHLRSWTNGYSLGARLHGQLLVSFYFYVDPTHSLVSLSIIPSPKESHERKSNDQP